MEYALVVLLCAGSPGGECSPSHYEKIAYAQGPVSRQECRALSLSAMMALPSPPDGRWYYGSCMPEDQHRKMAASHI